MITPIMLTQISQLEGLIANTDTLAIFSIFVMISVSFYLIIYLIGKILDDSKLSAWSKKGIIEVIFAIIILAAVLLSFPMIDTIMSLIFGSHTGTNRGLISNGGMASAGELSNRLCAYANGPRVPRDSAYYAVRDSCYLVMSVDFLDTTFRELFTLNKWMSIRYSMASIFANLYVSVHIAIDKQGDMSYAPLSGIYLPSNIVISEAFGWANKVMIVTKIQEVLIVFMATGGFAWIFLIGLILRPFAFTRKIGGDLMGIALAMLIIYPGFYAFGDYIMNSIRANIPNDAQYANVPDMPVFANMNFSDAYLPNNTFTGKAYPTHPTTGVGGWASYNAPQIARSSVSNRGGNIATTTEAKLKEANIQINPNATPSSNTNGPSWWNKLISSIKSALRMMSPFNQSPSVMYENGGLIDMVARGSFFSLWFGLLSVVGTIAGARSIGSMFGGDVEFAGLVRLI